MKYKGDQMVDCGKIKVKLGPSVEPKYSSMHHMFEIPRTLKNHQLISINMQDSDEADDFKTKSEQLITWLESSGAHISPKIELADLRHRSAGRGVLAKEGIKEDEELFRIPRSLILDASTSSLPEGLRNKLEDPWLCLILAMIREHRLGEMSAFKPYFNVLPDTFDTLMYWSEEELKYLTGSAVVNKIGKESADAAFQDKIVPIIRQHPDIFFGEGLTDEELISICHRMGSLIMAYAFDLEGPTAQPPSNANEEWEEDSDPGAILPKGMVPLADMLNADAHRNNAKLFYEDEGNVVMKTIAPVKQGDELFNDFGPLPRADLLRRYGYITDNYAQYDVVEISNDLIKSAVDATLGLDQQTFDARLGYLAEHGLDDDSWDIAHPASEDGQFSEELRVFLNLIALEPAEFDKLRAKDKLPKPELSDRALRLLQDVLARRAKMYESDLVTSDQSTDADNTRHTMARAVVEGEKQVLQDAKTAIQAFTNFSAADKRKADPTEAEARTQPETKKRKR
jgi:N-lysine methyltransferase SETD6